MRKIESRIISSLKTGRPLAYKRAFADDGGWVYHDQVVRTNTDGSVYRLLGTMLAHLAPDGRLTIGIAPAHPHAHTHTTRSRIRALCHGFGLRVAYHVRSFERGEYTL